MDWTKLLDPKFDPYSGLWGALGPLAHAVHAPELVAHLPDWVGPNAGLLAMAGTGLGLMAVAKVRRSLGKPAPAPRSDTGTEFAGRGLQVGLGLPRAVWWRNRPIPRKDRWQVGAYRISMKRKHAGIVGATGSRKSTLGVDLIRGDRPTVVLSGEPSDPFRAATLKLIERGKGLFWSSRGALGWNMLLGDTIEVPERLTAGTKKTDQDTGLGRGVVQDLIRYTLEACDRMVGVERNWADILDVLSVAAMPREKDKFKEAVSELFADRPYLLYTWTLPKLNRQVGPVWSAAQLRFDQQGQAACQRWRQRFEHMISSLGDAIGTDLDLEEELRKGQTVMMEMSSMRSPESTPTVAANILLDTKRALQNVKGGRLLVDEGWAFKERKGEIEAVVRAGRRLGWEVYVFTQLPQDYPKEMLGNMRTWIFLLQADANTEALEWCSKACHRHVPAEAFGEGHLKEGEGWLLTEGRLVKIKVKGRDYSKTPEVLPNPKAEPGVKNEDPGVIQEEEMGEPGTSEPGTRYEWQLAGPEVDVPGWLNQDEEDEDYEVVERGPRMLVGGTKVVPTCVLVPGGDGKLRRLEIFERLSGTWGEDSDWLWTGGRNRGYGKTSYLNTNGWETHFLFWAWRVLEDYDLDRDGDLERFYEEFPEIPEFDWPERGGELVVLRAFKLWMREPFGADPNSFDVDDPRYKVRLSLDHACPGFPNTLCSNYRHLRLLTWSRNSQLRHERRKGGGRLAAEAWAGMNQEEVSV